jgi:hypothetical protein
MSNAPDLSAYLQLGLPIVFLVLWCTTIALTAVLTGWHALSRRFTANSAPCGDTRTAGPWFSTVYMRYWCHYSSVIRITAAQDALYLSVLFPFSPGHAPLRIPWNEIRFARTRRFFLNFVELTLGSEEQIPFRIRERTARELGLFERYDPAKPAPEHIAP